MKLLGPLYLLSFTDELLERLVCPLAVAVPSFSIYFSLNCAWLLPTALLPIEVVPDQAISELPLAKSNVPFGFSSA